MQAICQSGVLNQHEVGAPSFRFDSGYAGCRQTKLPARIAAPKQISVDCRSIVSAILMDWVIDAAV
jgi:hypothetical protein